MSRKDSYEYGIIHAAFAAMQKTHSPYSQFPVGAALRTSDGRIYSGCNIEVVSYPEGWCAETTALSHFVMGGGGTITEIAVVAEKHKVHTLWRVPPALGGVCGPRYAAPSLRQ